MPVSLDETQGGNLIGKVLVLIKSVFVINLVGLTVQFETTSLMFPRLVKLLVKQLILEALRGLFGEIKKRRKKI